MSFMKTAYKEMLFWIGFGIFIGYFSYTYIPYVKFFRNHSKFQTIRRLFFAVPILVFTYHGVKFLHFYKNKGTREVSKDPSNLMSEQQYEEYIL